MPLSRHHSLHRPTHGPLSANSLQNRTLPATNLGGAGAIGSRNVVFCSRTMIPNPFGRKMGTFCAQMLFYVGFGSRNRLVCSRTVILSEAKN